MMLEPDIFPIPLRDDVVVRLHGVPHDLTAPEANKIYRVLMALAGTETGESIDVLIGRQLRGGE